MTESTKAPITKPLQKRSRATADEVLNALDALLRLHPLESISMQELARASGASMSSIYARFRDKHAMLLALHERVVALFGQHMQTQATRDFSGLEWQQIVTHVMGDYLHFARGHEHIYRAVAQSADPLISERVSDQIRLASRLCVAYLQTRFDPLPPELELRVDFAVRVVAATLQQTWVMQTRQPSCVVLDDVALVEQLTQMVLGYVALPTQQQDD